MTKKTNDVVIMGIDPGSTRIGVGVIEKRGGRLIKKEALLLTKEDLYRGEEGKKLLYIETSLKKIIKKTRPDVVGVENIFFSKNKKTAFSVAYARGIILKTFAEENVPVFEFTPNQIKSAVVGNGNASKKEVSKMVGYTLSMETDDLIDDVTDALATAITTSFFYKKER